MTRLPGWHTDGRPGRLPVRRRLRQPARAVRRLLRRTGRDRYDRDQPDRGTHRRVRRAHATTAPGVRARSSWPPARTADPVVPAAVGRADVPVITSNRYRNPGRLDCGRRPGRGCLGLRGADRRRARPVRPRRRPGGRAAHPGAASLPRDGHLLVAGVDRPARAHHRRGARPRRGAQGAFAAAGRTVPRRRGRERGRPGRAPARAASG